jgi:hypothetical protein
MLCWVCRDTAAGQALFKAYGGHQQAKVKGQQYSQRNQEIFQRMLALGVLPRPPKGEDCSRARASRRQLA